MISLRSLRLIPIVLVAGIALSACDADPSTGSLAQEINDCLGGPQFGQVPLPTIKPWDGVVPAGSGSTVFVIVQDPQAPGYYVVWQVEHLTQTIPWAREIPSGKMGNFLDQAILAGIIIRDPVPQPNPPPPPIIDGKDLLEIGYRAFENEQNILAIIQNN